MWLYGRGAYKIIDIFLLVSRFIISTQLETDILQFFVVFLQGNINIPRNLQAVPTCVYYVFGRVLTPPMDVEVICIDS